MQQLQKIQPPAVLLGVRLGKSISDAHLSSSSQDRGRPLPRNSAATVIPLRNARMVGLAHRRGRDLRGPGDEVPRAHAVVCCGDVIALATRRRPPEAPHKRTTSPSSPDDSRQSSVPGPRTARDLLWCCLSLGGTPPSRRTTLILPRRPLYSSLLLCDDSG
jgi:hypothetical protein